MTLIAAKEATYRGAKYSPGRVSSAQMLPPNVSPFRNLGEAKCGAKRRGVLYERKIFRRLSDLYAEIRIQPWFRYSDGRRDYFLQPDAVLFNDVDIWLFEVKYSHCLDAFWQMTNYYRPVLLKAFGERPVRRIEICHDFYSEVQFPDPIRFSLDVEEFLSRSSYDLASVEVIRWKP